MKIGKNSWLYFTYATWVIVEIFYYTTVETFLGIPKSTINSFFNIVISVMLMVQIIVLQTYKKKEIIVIIGITGLLMISAIHSGYLPIVSTWMFIVATKNIKNEELILIAKTILQILIPTVIALYFRGLIENDIMYRGTELRQSLGFSHPNQLGLRVFQWVACSVYLAGRRNLKISEIAIFVSCGLFVYLVPNSQSATICLILLVVGVLIFQLLRKRKKKQELFAKLLVVGAAMTNFFSVFLSLLDLSDFSLLKKMNKFLSSRFSAGHRVYELYGIKWIGQRVYVSQKEREIVGITEKLFLDNSYMTLLIRCGILVYLLFTISFLFLLWKLYKSENYKLLAILVTYSVYGIMENSVYMMTHNIFIITMGMLLYQKKCRTVSKEESIMKLQRTKSIIHGISTGCE